MSRLEYAISRLDRRGVLVGDIVGIVVLGIVGTVVRLMVLASSAVRGTAATATEVST